MTFPPSHGAINAPASVTWRPSRRWQTAPYPGRATGWSRRGRPGRSPPVRSRSAHTEPGLEGVGEVDGLQAPARRCFGFSGGDEASRQAAPAQTRRHPQALRFTAVAPGPPADAGYNPATVADEDRQVGFAAESHGDGRLTADLRFQDFDVSRIRMVLDVELYGGRLVRHRRSARSARCRRSTSRRTGSSRRGSRPR